MYGQKKDINGATTNRGTACGKLLRRGTADGEHAG